MRWVLVSFILLACPQPGSAQRLEVADAPTIITPQPAPAGFFRIESVGLNRRLRDEEDSLLNGALIGGAVGAALGVTLVLPMARRTSTLVAAGVLGGALGIQVGAAMDAALTKRIQIFPPQVESPFQE